MSNKPTKINLNREDVNELVERATEYKRFLEDGSFSATSKKELLDSQLYVVLLLRDEIKKLQRELNILKQQNSNTKPKKGN